MDSPTKLSYHKQLFFILLIFLWSINLCFIGFQYFREKQYKSERKLALNLYIAQSVLNSDAQTSAIQKATELGVKGIIPLYTDNCAVKESVIKKFILITFNIFSYSLLPTT